MKFLKDELDKFLNSIEETDKKCLKQAEDRLDNLVKPPKSLGKLEDIASKLASITGNINNSLDKRCVIIMTSDNGVCDEGVSSAPQAVTCMQTINFTKGITGVAVLAHHFKSDLIIVDVGINADINNKDIINRKIRKSTGNIVKEQAMTYEEAIEAINVGIEMARNVKEQGYNVVGVGEMGIGNTTTSSAVLSSLLNIDIEDISNAVDRGAGLTDDRFAHKIDIIKKAVKLHKPDSKDPINVLSKLGGFDIAAMAGAFIGAAYYKLPVVIDGFISIVAALCAYRLNPLVKEYMFTSHHSCERGYTLAMKELELEPSLNLDMRLGEGSGCPIMFSIMDAACSIINDMGTFEEGQIGDEYLNNLS